LERHGGEALAIENRKSKIENLFVSLDGLDGTGKSTQCRLLAEWLRGRGLEPVLCVDPGSTAVGETIRSLLLQHRPAWGLALPCEALLFMASRAQLVHEVIRPALEAGRPVVADRFLLANVVYQGYGGGLDPRRLWDIGRFATGGLDPDLTLVLDLPPEVALARRAGAPDRVESRDAAYHRRVREGFLAEARLHAERVRVIDAGRPIDVVQECIRQEVERVLEAGAGA
jgi:dTMP kinase